MNTHHTPTSFCLKCGHTVDAASNIVGGGKPKPGDITICLNCSALLQFDAQLRLMLTDEAQMMREMKPRQRAKVEHARQIIQRLGPTPRRDTKH
jgi:hypothetical protein